MRYTIAKLAIGTAGGAMIEGIDQAAQVTLPLVEQAAGAEDPALILKMILQVITAIATVVSLFIKPKAKDQPQQQAPFMQVLPKDPPAATCARGLCAFPDLCSNGQCAQHLADQVEQRITNQPK